MERGCGRLELWCLDWNRPSIDFYRFLGAKPMNEWTVYRITGDTLKNNTVLVINGEDINAIDDMFEELKRRIK